MQFLPGRASLVLFLTASVLLGGALVYWQPRAPLLAYWLIVAIGAGIWIALTDAITGIRARAKTLIAAFAVLIGSGLATTQIAARRTISETHLNYRGVHLLAVDSFTVGAGQITADIKLQTTSPTQVPWLLQFTKQGTDWAIAAVQGVEQVRLRRGESRRGTTFDIAHASVLREPGDRVTVIDPAGNVVDTISLGDHVLTSADGDTFALNTSNAAIRSRYGWRLRAGTALAMLEGKRATSDVYERFVRAQRLREADIVNGGRLTILARVLPGGERILISAAPPYRLAGELVQHDRLTLNDSVTVEVRSGDGTWRFAIHPSWRREPSADPGVSILFQRNPRPLDTPLPVGVSCQTDVACAAISLRRLPHPIAHIALNQGGFDSEHFGLLGKLQVIDDGYSVILPRETYDVKRQDTRPVAIPVVNLAEQAQTRAPRPTRWVLLGAAGQSENLTMIFGVAVGLGFLLWGLYLTVGAVSVRLNARITRLHERTIIIGLTAILSLLLARITLGARVRFFAPFLQTGIDTAVGLFVATAVVAVGLLTWSHWLPPLLLGARGTMSGQRSWRALIRGIAQYVRLVYTRLIADAWRATVLFGISLLVLGCFTNAVFFGLLAGCVVLLAWVTVAWVASFTAAHFETYEKGAHAVVELLPGSSTVRHELYLVLSCILAELAHLVPWPAIIASVLVFMSALWLVPHRRRRNFHARQPDLFAASMAVAAFVAIVSLLRLNTVNGAMGLFLLVVFVALSSVRVGRSLGGRLDASPDTTTGTTWSDVGESLLLLVPLLFLLPLAGIDMGLFLVMVIPLGFATLLAMGTRTAGWRAAPLLGAMLIVIVLAGMVVFPSIHAISSASSHEAQATSFADMSKLFGLRVPGLSTPMDRAAARAVATRDRTAAEKLLVAAGPGAARDLLIPSIEQIWGAKAYASAGPLGEGLGRAVVGGRGVAETVSYAENTFSVFVLAEHGALGGVLVLGLYSLLVAAIAFFVRRSTSNIPSQRASRALFVVAGLIVAIPAAYVALSNIGRVPITGQNMPFLGLNAWSDVTLCAGIVGILITGVLRGLEETQ